MKVCVVFMGTFTRREFKREREIAMRKVKVPKDLFYSMQPFHIERWQALMLSVLFCRIKRFCTMSHCLRKSDVLLWIISTIYGWKTIPSGCRFFFHYRALILKIQCCEKTLEMYLCSIFFKIYESFFGATDTPVLNFWWRLPWVSKPSWIPSLRALSPRINFTMFNSKLLHSSYRPRT